MDETRSDEETLFDAARNLKSDTERARFLEIACAGRLELRRRVEDLLAGLANADAFLADAGQESAFPTMDRTKPAAVSGATIDRYKLLERIGEGGFGEVWAAEQREPVKRRVAVKIIKAGMDTRQVVARFEAERQALALMDHPNIARVFDAGATETGRPFFVMELVRGVSITRFCDQERLSARDRMKLFVQVCQAVQHAHQKGIIHRDIKPSNVLVTLHDGVAVPKIIDFGIAKATHGTLTDKTVYTQFQQFIGTPAYMSPEQAEMSGLDIDTRADIYSLGVLLYELLTGKTPFDAKHLLNAGLDEMRRVIRQDEPDRPSMQLNRLTAADRTTLAENRRVDIHRLVELCRGDLDWVVMKCLEKDRSRRYETTNGLAADLTRYLNNEPVSARPPSAMYRFRKACKRHKAIFISGTVVVLSLLTGLGVSIWSFINERAARGIAEAAEAKASRLLYASNMNLVQQSWENLYLIDRTHRLLAETEPYPEKGFEWDYWQGQTHLEKWTLRGHQETITDVAFSPDGKRIASSARDGTVRLWDPESGEELRVFEAEPDLNMAIGLEVEALAFSPDGKQLAAAFMFRGDFAGKTLIWNLVNGDLTTIGEGDGSGRGVAFFPDGQRLVTCGESKAKVWDIQTKKELVTLEGDMLAPRGLALSPAGDRVFIGRQDGHATIWNASTGKNTQTLEKKLPYRIWGAGFCPDGALVATGGVGHNDDYAKIWDVATGKMIRTLKGHNFGVMDLTFSSDGSWLVAGGGDAVLRLWGVTDGRSFSKLRGHESTIRAVALSPDDRLLVSGGDDRTLKVWDLTSAKERIRLKGHDGPVRSIAFNPNGTLLASGGDDGSIRLWDVAAERQLTVISNAHERAVWSIEFSPDGQTLLTGGWEGTTKLWDVPTKRNLTRFDGHSGPVRSVAFSPDGDWIVTGGEDGTAIVRRDVDTDIIVLNGHGDAIHSVAVSPDGKFIVTGSEDGTSKVWNGASGEEIMTLSGHRAPVRVVRYSPDGDRILSGAFDLTIKFWDAATGKVLFTTPTDTLNLSADFSPDGLRIVTGGTRGVQIRDAMDGRPLADFSDASDGADVAFSPDGQVMAAASADETGNVVLWKAATNFQTVLRRREKRPTQDFSIPVLNYQRHHQGRPKAP